VLSDKEVLISSKTPPRSCCCGLGTVISEVVHLQCPRSQVRKVFDDNTNRSFLINGYFGVKSCKVHCTSVQYCTNRRTDNRVCFLSLGLEILRV
jgi:hypothetical protein